MGRVLPTDCAFCGLVTDWGDFGDGPVPCICTCLCEETLVAHNGRPRRVTDLHPDCPWHGRRADPDGWATVDNAPYAGGAD